MTSLRRGLRLALLLAVPLGCAHAEAPSGGGGAAAADPTAAPSAKAPGAKAVEEHVFLYPLDEALAAARDVLESHDYDVGPFGDNTQLVTRWRHDGPRVADQPSVPLHLRRYYVQGQALSPRHSVVRIFRIDREEAKTEPGTPREELDLAAELAPRDAQEGNTGAGGDPEGWRQFVASGMELSNRDRPRTEPNERIGMKTQTRLKDPNDLRRQLGESPTFAGQYRMPTQDELRGRNEQGLRDAPYEAELVARLEQFPSLEFVGGAADVPPPPAPAGAPPYTEAWLAESGGMPFTKGGPCGEPVAGLEPLAQPGSNILVGEQLGTRELPAAVGNMACQLATAGRTVLLGLSLPSDEQGAVDAYVRSAGTRQDQDALLAQRSWRQVPRDGRSSRALLVLLERVRRWRAGGLAIQPIAFDAREERGNEREAAMAERLIKRRRMEPETVLLVLGGNYHASAAGGVLWSRSFEPLGHRLERAGLQPRSLDTAFERGTRWACNVNRHREAECRVYASSPSAASATPPGTPLGITLFASKSSEGFHGLLHVGRITASLPALPPRSPVASR
ncbi:hypothetical protein FGE12_20820 [Aggregicoccus sp. 17bor-14]|uniref:hypothetical protein n=1 Tax=Myxococcaceae TaxID=31 RepID=UPI00129CA511|nr:MULTISPECIES: hypothetical protein [Myxococcaceae]MBF5044855.1 hypothetical protein [Simulacricoccus sp. 17bor-14]MRI90599.1 hypothetical protein [Aggregicoccus sp. 17bor-14]